MILNEHLKFEEHIDYLVSKTVQKLGILHKSRDFLDCKTSLLLYKSLVLLQFVYCDTVYDCASDAHLQQLQKLQNCACRTMLSCNSRTPIIEMHQTLDLLTLNERCKLHLSLDYFIHINNPDSSLHKYVKFQTGRVTRTGDMCLELPNLKTNFGRSAFSYRGPDYWMKLPDDIKGITSRPCFKRACINKMRDQNHPT